VTSPVLLHQILKNYTTDTTVTSIGPMKIIDDFYYFKYLKIHSDVRIYGIRRLGGGGHCRVGTAVQRFTERELSDRSRPQPAARAVDRASGRCEQRLSVVPAGEKSWGMALRRVAACEARLHEMWLPHAAAVVPDCRTLLAWRMISKPHGTRQGRQRTRERLLRALTDYRYHRRCRRGDA